MEQVGKVGETSNRKFSKESLRENQLEQLHTLKKEAEKNSFQVLFNNKNLQEIKLWKILGDKNEDICRICGHNMWWVRFFRYTYTGMW